MALSNAVKLLMADQKPLMADVINFYNSLEELQTPVGIYVTDESIPFVYTRHALVCFLKFLEDQKDNVHEVVIRQKNIIGCIVTELRNEELDVTMAEYL